MRPLNGFLLGQKSPAGDIFSLGAVLVFASTGHGLVTDDGGPMTQVLKVARGQLELDDVPQPIKSLVVRCVAKHPQDRPTAVELVRILAASGVAQPTAGWLGVGGKPAKLQTFGWTRRRVMAAASGTGAAIVLGGSGWLAAGGLNGSNRAGQPTVPVSASPSQPPVFAPKILWQQPSTGFPKLVHSTFFLCLQGQENGGGFVTRDIRSGEQVHHFFADDHQDTFIARENVLLALGTGKVTAFNLITGETLYGLPTNESGWTATDQWLLNLKGKILTGYDLWTGRRAFQRNLQRELLGLYWPPDSSPNLVLAYEHPDNPNLVAVDCRTGDIAWRFPNLDGRSYCCGTWHGLYVIATVGGTHALTITVVNAETGQPELTVSTGTALADPRRHQIQVVDDHVLASPVRSGNGIRVRGFPLTKGLAEWELPAETYFPGAIACDHEMHAFYRVNPLKQQLVASSTTSGNPLWTLDIPAGEFSFPPVPDSFTDWHRQDLRMHGLALLTEIGATKTPRLIAITTRKNL